MVVKKAVRAKKPAVSVLAVLVVESFLVIKKKAVNAAVALMQQVGAVKVNLVSPMFFGPMKVVVPFAKLRRRPMQLTATRTRRKPLAEHVPINYARTALPKRYSSVKQAGIKRLVDLVSAKEIVGIKGMAVRVEDTEEQGAIIGVNEVVGVKDRCLLGTKNPGTRKKNAVTRWR